MKKIILTVLLVFTPLLCFSFQNIEQEQKSCIIKVYNEGSKLQLYGQTWGLTTASIAYQESWCNSSKWKKKGIIVGDLDRNGKPKSLGIMQVQVATAKFVMMKYPQIKINKYNTRTPSDQEIMIDLLLDDDFNIKVGVQYFGYLLKYRHGNIDKAILSYNRGNGDYLNDVNNYVKKTRYWMKTIIRPVVWENKKPK